MLVTPGIRVLYKSSGQQIRPGLIKRISADANQQGCRGACFQPTGALWAQNVYRPVTGAPGEAVCSPENQVQIILQGEVYNSAELADYLGVDHSGMKSIKVNYADLFRRLESWYPQLEDVSRGWARLTSLEAVLQVLEDLKAGGGTTSAQKLSAWLTLQLYREGHRWAQVW